MKILPGTSHPLGATFTDGGVNFAIFSKNATAVKLGLFNDAGDDQPSEVIELEEQSHFIWHCFVPSLQPGQLYGYYIDGPFEPREGHRFNKHKLLIDPYAKALSGQIKWNDSVYAFIPGHVLEDLSFNDADSTPFVPKSVVVDTAFDWEDDVPLRTPYHHTIIYELHVKGFTQLNPYVPEEMRGRYAALGHPAVVTYLKDLGVTAVELLPVHAFLPDADLEAKGLTNYWGYNTIGFFSPEAKYASGDRGEQVREFKEMVKQLHKAGIEVIIDVVYNHSAEKDQSGPTVCFRGIDNANYYRLKKRKKRYYTDYSDTGNTLNAEQPVVLRLIMDSLRYWINDMHVDGFRFDLAPALARELNEMDQLSSFFTIICQDPLISRVKLIAEPWDLGKRGYQVGEFPPGWAEWNGRYRDCMRKFWIAEDEMLQEFALRFTGSPDLYDDQGRTPFASINFISSHDGFTLHDLVTYNQQHNQDNGAGNDDGTEQNYSFNWAVEGETDNATINELRKLHKRNLITTLFLSQGVPMFLAGDEMANTQHGNNNAYCQDNEITWLNWGAADEELKKFTQRIIWFRKLHPVFSRYKWFKGKGVTAESDDIAWFAADGLVLDKYAWEKEAARSAGIFLNGDTLQYRNSEGETVKDDSFFIVLNGADQFITFQLPGEEYGRLWQKEIDTTEPTADFAGEQYQAAQSWKAKAFSITVFKRISNHEKGRD